MAPSVRRRLTPVSYAKQLLEAIIYVREQKQIPNFERISKYLQRYSDITPRRCKEHLNNAVSDGFIVEYTAVGFKGQRTGLEQEGYRIPKKDEEDSVLLNDGHDWYCFECHKPGEVFECNSCFRVYHQGCTREDTTGEIFVCSVCRASKKKNKMKKKMLNTLLSYTILRLREKILIVTRELHKISQKARGDDFKRFVFKRMDLNKMEQKVQASRYRCLEDFHADARTILHNCYLLFGDEKGGMTDLAVVMVKDCKYDLDEIELCPNCYYMSNAKPEDWFAQPCNPPHELVYAKQKGYSYWPAKIVQDVGGKSDVRFFGGWHQRAIIPAEYIKPITDDIKTLGIKKTPGFTKALKELQRHQEILEERERDREANGEVADEEEEEEEESKEEEEEEEEPEEEVPEEEDHQDEDYEEVKVKAQKKRTPKKGKPGRKRKSESSISLKEEEVKEEEEEEEEEEPEEDDHQDEDYEEEVKMKARKKRTPKKEKPGRKRKSDTSLNRSKTKVAKRRKREETEEEEEEEEEDDYESREVTSTSVEKKLKKRQRNSSKYNIQDEYTTVSSSGQVNVANSPSVAMVSTSIQTLSQQTVEDAEMQTDPVIFGSEEECNEREAARAREQAEASKMEERMAGAMAQLTQRLEEKFEADKKEALNELSARLEADFGKDKQQAVERTIATMKLEVEKARKSGEDSTREQYMEEMKKLAAKHKEAISSAKKKQWCQSCEDEAIYHCCWNTSYCSTKCQQVHWHKEHKRVCRRKRPESSSH